MGAKKIKLFGIPVLEIEDSRSTDTNNKSFIEEFKENGLFDKELLRIVVAANDAVIENVFRCFDSENDNKYLRLKTEFNDRAFPESYKSNNRVEFLDVYTYMLHIYYLKEEIPYSINKLVEINDDILSDINSLIRQNLTDEKFDYLKELNDSDRSKFIYWEKIKLFNLYFLYNYTMKSYEVIHIDDVAKLKDVFDQDEYIGSKILDKLELL